MRHTTVCFLVRNTLRREVLLGYKKHGFGVGKIVVIGGKVEPGETIAGAACRELYEEIGITVEEQDLQARGSIAFRFPNQPSWDQAVHVFIVTRWRGEPQESDEMRPSWHAVNTAPFDQMWDDSRYWLPRVLSGETLQATITFADDNATVCDARFVTAG